MEGHGLRAEVSKLLSTSLLIWTPCWLFVTEILDLRRGLAGGRDERLQARGVLPGERINELRIPGEPGDGRRQPGLRRPDIRVDIRAAEVKTVQINLGQFSCWELWRTTMPVARLQARSTARLRPRMR